MTPKIPKQVKSKPIKFDVRQTLSDGLNNLTENNQPKKAINNSVPKRKHGEINNFSTRSIL